MESTEWFSSHWVFFKIHVGVIIKTQGSSWDEKAS